MDNNKYLQELQNNNDNEDKKEYIELEDEHFQRLNEINDERIEYELYCTERADDVNLYL